MPSSRTYKRSLKPLRRYHIRKPQPKPAPGVPSRINWLMTLVIVAVTIWSCADGRQSPTMMVIASVASVAAVNVLALLAAALPPTRLVSALTSGLWVLLFLPAWDWLAGQYAFPDSLYTALAFAGAFVLIRWLMRSGPSRPPW